MADLRFLVRPLLAAPFIIGGLSTFRAPRGAAAKAEDVALPLAEVVGLPQDSVQLVKINAGVQIVGGAMLAFGIMPRLASIALAGSVVPTTAAAYPFWKQKDPAARKADLMQFAKNAGLLGGLLIHALDTGGRPSVFWSSRRAIGHAAGSLSSVAQSVAETVANTVGTAVHALPGVD